MRKAIWAIQRLLFRILWKGDLIMMAMLLAQRIILGKLEYAKVPSTLKEQVADILRDSGLDDLIGE